MFDPRLDMVSDTVELSGSNTNLCLRESEICPNKDYPSATTPNESSIPLKVPCLRIHEIVFECTSNDTGDIRHVASQTHGFLSEASGPNLGRESPT
jgi:hypothetical protein